MINLPKTEQEATALWDSLKPLYADLKPSVSESEELEKILTEVKKMFAIGDRVYMKHTCYIGLVYGFNENLGGFYPGIRYPICVKIIESQDPKFSNVVGSKFEYGAEQVFHHKERYYKINAGHAAVDQGAKAPLNKLFLIAELADQRVMTGDNYGDDYLHVPLDTNKRKAMEDLFDEEKLIWSITEHLPRHILEL